MKCPKGRHDNYCSEEDSLYNTEADAAECVLCIRDERNALAEALRGIFAQTAKHSREWGQAASAAAFARDPDTAKAFAAARAALEKVGAA